MGWVVEEDAHGRPERLLMRSGEGSLHIPADLAKSVRWAFGDPSAVELDPAGRIRHAAVLAGVSEQVARVVLEQHRKPREWWQRSLTLVSGCNWPEGETPEECRNCCAKPMIERFAAIHGGQTREIREAQIINGHPVADTQPLSFDRVLTHPDRLADLKPTGKSLIWLCSIAGDLFHPDVPNRFVCDALDHIVTVHMARQKMGKKPHRIAILTKRYERAVELIQCWSMKSPQYDGDKIHYWGGAIPSESAKAFILMPSAGTQNSVDRACAAMAKLPAEVQWGLHCEPLLGPLDLSGVIGRAFDGMATDREYIYNAELAWVVVGGETNVRNRRAARPCHPDWVRGIKGQCQAAGVPLWVFDGQTWDELPKGW